MPWVCISPATFSSLIVDERNGRPVIAADESPLAAAPVIRELLDLLGVFKDFSVPRNACAEALDGAAWTPERIKSRDSIRKLVSTG